jgi:hypothetical protein
METLENLNPADSLLQVAWGVFQHDASCGIGASCVWFGAKIPVEHGAHIHAQKALAHALSTGGPQWKHGRIEHKDMSAWLPSCKATAGLPLEETHGQSRRIQVAFGLELFLFHVPSRGFQNLQILGTRPLSPSLLLTMSCVEGLTQALPGSGRSYSPLAVSISRLVQRGQSQLQVMAIVGMWTDLLISGIFHRNWESLFLCEISWLGLLAYLLWKPHETWTKQGSVVNLCLALLVCLQEQRSERFPRTLIHFSGSPHNPYCLGARFSLSWVSEEIWYPKSTS